MRGNQAWFVRDFLGRNRHVFRVPVYQRNYNWVKLQCEKLYRDILETKENDEQHFMGYIAYTKGFNSADDITEVLVIDGQQRITTLYLLLKALYDIAVEEKSVSVENEIADVIFNRNCDEKDKVKLRLNKVDNKQLSYLFENKLEKMNRFSNVYKNYVLFVSLIKETLKTDLDLGDILEGVKKLEICEAVFDIRDGDNPQAVFESINSTGMDLTLSDLVKNYLLMDTSSQNYLYNSYWLNIESNVGSKNLNDFMKTYVDSKTIGAVNSDKAYDRFKAIIKEQNYNSEQMLFLLRNLSKCYGTFVGHKNYYNSKVQDYLRGLYYTKQSVMMPLVFRFFEDYEKGNINEETLTKVLEYTLTYAIRVTITDSTKGLNILMKTFYGWVIKNNNYDNYYEKFVATFNICNDRVNNRMPSDEKVREALVYSPFFRKDVCRYIFSVLEKGSKENLVFNIKALDHILPEKTSNLWRDEIGEKDYARVHEIYLHTLGNLTYMGYKGPAKNIKNKSFADKKAVIKANNANSVLNKDIVKIEHWNEEAIVNRAKRLGEILVKDIFPYIPTPVGFEKKNEDVCLNIMDKIDISSFNPTEVVLFGNVFQVKNFAEVLEKFIRVIYETDSVRLSKIVLDEKFPDHLREESSKTKLKKPVQIKNSSIFYEGDLSPKEVVDFIKILVSYLKINPNNINLYQSK